MKYIKEIMQRKMSELNQMAKTVEFVTCNDLLIGAGCWFDTDTVGLMGKDTYYPFHKLTYIESGYIDVTFEGQTFTMQPGRFYVVRKFTDAYMQYRVTDSNPNFVSYALGMYNHVLERVMDRFESPYTRKPMNDRILDLEGSKHLDEMKFGLVDALHQKLPIMEEKFESMVYAGLLGIVESNPAYLAIFQDYSKYDRGDLELFMNRNFKLKYSLEQFAQLSGRSLSTFNREFRSIFNTTPHKWLLRKRLLWGDTLLKTTSKSISEIAFEMNFEDVAHFSKTYKKEFGQNPLVTKTTPYTKPVYSFIEPEKR